MKIYKIVGLSKDSSEVVNERICILRTCSSNPQTPIPAGCKNTQCSSMMFEDRGWLSSNTEGVTFTVKAEAADHSNCYAEQQVLDADGEPTKIHPVTIPDPPSQVMVDSVYGSGAITINFGASTTYVDAPILSYTLYVYRWDGAGTPGTELYKKIESRDISGEQLSFTFDDVPFDFNRDHFVKVEATNVVGTGALSQMSNTVTVAPKESDAAKNVREAKAGDIPSVVVTFAVTLPGLEAGDFRAQEFKDYYTDAVADAVHVLPEYVEIVNVTTVACANPECSLFQVLDGYERRLSDFPSAVQLDFQITLPAPDPASFAVAQADAATTMSMINLSPDLFLDDMTSNLRESDMQARYPLRKWPTSVFVGAPSSAETSPSDLEGEGGEPKQIIGGVSDYATYIMIVGACCALMGSIFFVMAKERVMTSGGGNGQGIALPIDQSAVLGTAPGDKKFAGATSGWKRASLQDPAQASRQSETSFFTEMPSEVEAASFTSVNPALAKQNKHGASRTNMRPSAGGAGAGGKKRQELGKRVESRTNMRPSTGGKPSALRSSSANLGARRSTTRKSEVKAPRNSDMEVRESSFDAGSLTAAKLAGNAMLGAIDHDEEDDRIRAESTMSTVSTRSHSVDV